jgi:hypothetical protein
MLIATYDGVIYKHLLLSVILLRVVMLSVMVLVMGYSPASATGSGKEKMVKSPTDM